MTYLFSFHNPSISRQYQDVPPSELGIDFFIFTSLLDADFAIEHLARPTLEGIQLLPVYELKVYPVD